MKLYYTPGTCSVACWIALKWSGLEFEVERVKPSSPEYIKINPLGMVPALDIGGPRAMTEADAILSYIADLAPDAKLGSDGDPLSQFALNETMAFISADLHPAFWPWFGPMRYTTATDQESYDQVRAAAEIRIDRAMTHLDGLVDEQGYLYRGRRSIADALAFIMARWTQNMSKSWDKYPGIKRLVDRMNADPVVQEVLQKSTAQ